MDRIAGMEAFVAVVEAGGFQAAARQLGISRALVSKRLSALERILGVQLLHRTTRRLSVTGPGSAFYESCQRILGEYPPRDRRADRSCSCSPAARSRSTRRCRSASCTWRRR